MSSNKLVETFAEKGITVEQAASSAAALARLQELIPDGSSIMTASSQTLEQIGFTEYLETGKHPWRDLKKVYQAEDDSGQRLRLRREATLADYFLGSVHAIAETGELVWQSQTGSQLPGYIYNAQNVIWVASTHKIVKDLPAAIEFTEKVSLRKHIERLGGDDPSRIFNGKTLIFHKERSKRNLRLILVDEPLGYVP